jgi:hypothetical protein
MRIGLRLGHFQQRHGAIGQQMRLGVHQRFRGAREITEPMNGAGC